MKKMLCCGSLMLLAGIPSTAMADVSRGSATERIHAAREAHHKAVLREKTDSAVSAEKPKKSDCRKIKDVNEREACEEKAGVKKSKKSKKKDVVPAAKEDAEAKSVVEEEAKPPAEGPKGIIEGGPESKKDK